MPDPEETERECLVSLLMDARDKYPRDSRDIDSEELADVILAAGFRRLSESEMLRQWGVLGPRGGVAQRLDERSAREWVATHPHDVVVSRPVGAWTKEADRG